MNNFKNKTEQDFWIECIRHAERLKETKGSFTGAEFYKSDYIKYADEMLEELRKRKEQYGNNTLFSNLV